MFVELGPNGQGIKFEEYQGRWSLVTGRKLDDGRIWIDFCHGQVNNPSRLPHDKQHMVVELPQNFEHKRWVWNKARPHGIYLGDSKAQALATLKKAVQLFEAGSDQPQGGPAAGGTQPNPFG